MKITKTSILDLALAITAKNISKGREYLKKEYVGNRQIRTKAMPKNKVYKTSDGMVFHVRGNMSGDALKNLMIKNEVDIDNFSKSKKKMMKL
jgi:hypothetical protein